MHSKGALHATCRARRVPALLGSTCRKQPASARASRARQARQQTPAPAPACRVSPPGGLQRSGARGARCAAAGVSSACGSRTPRQDHPFGFSARTRILADGSTNILLWDCQVPGKAGTAWEGADYALTLGAPSHLPRGPRSTSRAAALSSAGARRIFCGLPYEAPEGLGPFVERRSLAHHAPAAAHAAQA